ncbi:LacI family DNA-binding transcriptional regulator, partial [candidate division KSB1 bacterium]|nr:LacI family DNA-binding transcriptional regulator [candidate division KSB1 bacterium]
GVGIGTVSRAINNSPNIHPATKARILKIAQELNYLPHALAQSLARKKTQTVGCIVPFFTNYFTAELLKQIQHALTDSNYDLILFSLDHMQRLGKMLDRVLAERRVDGVLLISVSLEERHVERLINQDLPVVLVDSLSPKIDYVSVNNFTGAVQATRHLIQLGHQAIGLINGSLKSLPARLRHDGFRQALLEGGLSYDERYCVVGEFNRREHGFNEETGYSAMQRLLRRKITPPSALFVASDVQALGAIHAAEEVGLRIPDDIALVGFDDIEFAKFVGLTTMRQPVEEMAHAAVRRIVDRMQGARASEFKLELMPELIVRESCGCRRHFCVGEQIA